MTIGTRSLFFTLLTCAIVSAVATAQWSDDSAENLVIADRASEQVIPQIACMSDGGLYIAWFDHASGNYDVYLQRLDPLGNEQWNHNGILISDHAQNSWLVDWDLIVDSDDNAIVAFVDTRGGSDWDVYGYKVSPAGDMLWGADGVTLSDNPDFDSAPQIAETTDGDLVFVWPRSPDVGDGGIMMQRLSPEGVARFAAGGLTIAQETGTSPAFCRVVASLDGSVIVSWVRDISTFLSPRHIRAQRFSTTGAPLWSGHVEVFDAVSVPLGYYPDSQPDDQGGAIFWWHRSQNNLFNSLVQRVDADGAELFPHDGVVVSTTAGMHHISPTLSYKQDSQEIFVFWNERNSNQSQWGIFGQKFSVAGMRQWGDGGVQLRPVNSDYKLAERSVPYADGAMIFYIEEPGGVSGQDIVVGMRVDGNGNSIWPGSVLDVASAPSSKSRLPVTIDAFGVAKLVWEDDRNDTIDLYAQNVRPDGTLGNPPASIGNPGTAAALQLRMQPNPFTHEAAIRYLLPRPGYTKIGIYEPSGRLVRTLLDRIEPAGEGSILWDGRDDTGREVGTGVYLYKLSLDGERRAGRIVRVR